MSLESPPRLKLDAELGPILRAADPSIGDDRIATNGAAVHATIARGLAAAFPLWKLGVPLLVLVGALAVQRAVPDRVVAELPPPELARPRTEPVALAIAHVEHDDAPPIAEPPQRIVVAPSPPPPPPSPEPPASDLPEQIRLYEAARAAGGRGELALGLATLDELLRKFPATQLRADAELTRAELLVRADRLGDAAVALEALAADAAHRGRRGELLRTLGDVRRKQADCPRAIDAYTRARAAGLSAAEQGKVTRGLERCAPR